MILSHSYKIPFKNKSIFETVHFIELIYLAKQFPQTSYTKQNKKSQDRKQKVAIKSDEKSLKRFGAAFQTSSNRIPIWKASAFSHLRETIWHAEAPRKSISRGRRIDYRWKIIIEPLFYAWSRRTDTVRY